jgi:scyllo-inositol 2-dehydrogenase (NADP+)
MAGVSQSRLAVLALLAGRTHDYERLARPLLHGLEKTHHFQIEIAGNLDQLDPQRHQVVLAASDEPLAGTAGRLTDFVRGGGGLVLLHGTLATWNEGGALAELAAWTPSGPGPLSELVLRLDPSHPVTARLGPELRLTDELYMSEGPPADATALIKTSWQYTEQVVAYQRSFGAGMLIQVGLGHSRATYEDAAFQKLIHRSLLYAAGRSEGATTGVGLIGYGAIGRDHAHAVAGVEGLRLAGVCDISAERRELAARELGVAVHASAAQMFEDPEVGLVVVGTPPVAHADSVLSALAAGRHVVCEKPFALRVEEVDRMVDAASSKGLVLTVYQSRRWDPDFIAMREAIRSGRIGEPFYMESFIGGYSHPCDFWHSHEPISGGTIYDWGSHYFDWVLQLFAGSVKTVSARAHKRVWHDVTNADQVRVDLTFEGGAQATFLQSDIAAAVKPKWYVLGTRGAVVGEWRDTPVPADHPALVKVMTPREGGTNEELIALPPHDPGGFYRNLADHLVWGEALAVRPDEARRTVAVMEAATLSIRRGTEIEVDI